MKRLLRQGWVRAGIPVSSIESLADHSWGVAVLAFIFALMENSLQIPSLKVDANKCALIGLFHDFRESEFLDIDKSLDLIVGKEQASKIKSEIDKKALINLLNKFPVTNNSEFKALMEDNYSREYKIARIADFTDLILQTSDYTKKNWLDKSDSNQFEASAFKELNSYESEFLFIKQLKKDLETQKS